MSPDIPTRIVHVAECLEPDTLDFLALATAELATAGLRQVLVFARQPDPRPDLPDRLDHRVALVEVPGIDQGAWRHVSALRTAIDRAMQGQPGRTVVHLHAARAGWAGRLALLGMRERPWVLYSPHGLSLRDRRWWLPVPAARALAGLAAPPDATLVGSSRGETALLTRLAGRRARLLERAVDDSFHALRPRPTPDGRPVVLAMGRLCPDKAPEMFAALAVHFRIAEVEARFVWIGDGDPAARERLLAAGVEVTGWGGRPAVQALLARATVFVETSRGLAMPRSVLEALAAGVPCVVADGVGNRDAVRQGITGFVTRRLEEALVCVRRLLDDRALRERFGMAARRDARQRFSRAGLRERLLALYGQDRMSAQAMRRRPVRPGSGAAHPGQEAGGRPGRIGVGRPAPTLTPPRAEVLERAGAMAALPQAGP